MGGGQDRCAGKMAESEVAFTLQALTLHSDLLPLVLFSCSGYNCKCLPSADCNVNSSHSWSEPHAQLNINDVTHRALIREAAAEAGQFV